MFAAPFRHGQAAATAVLNSFAPFHQPIVLIHRLKLSSHLHTPPDTIMESNVLHGTIVHYSRLHYIFAL